MGSLCLCLLLLAGPGTCSASTYTVTSQELTQLEAVFSELRTTNAVLMSDSTKSQQDLIRALKLLRESREELKRLQEQLITLRNESLLAKDDLKQANLELAKASESFKQYEKETNSKINSLRRDRTLWEVVGGLAIGALVYSTVK